MKDSLKKHSTLMIPLAIFSLLFLIKGIVYLTIGSSVPFFISAITLLLFIRVLLRINKNSRRIIRFLGVLLTLWGFSRLLISVLFAIVPLTEAHINEQFTLFGTAISFIALVTGIYVIKYAKGYASVSE